MKTATEFSGCWTEREMRVAAKIFAPLVGRFTNLVATGVIIVAGIQDWWNGEDANPDHTPNEKG